jgi:prepilin-type N-terminal cleavage/methylation domain-containing protein
MNRGFTLLELAMVLLISGLIAGLTIKFTQHSGTKECYTTTRTQIQTIHEAIERFARSYERLPLPAARNIGIDNPSFGREATALEITAGALNEAAGVSFGALPFQALGLDPSFAGDCWNNKYSYAVTTALTISDPVIGYGNSAISGNITLRSDVSNSINTTTAYAVISHGEDGLGAVKTNYSGASHGWCTSPVSLATLNCRASEAEIVTAELNNGKDAANNYFDDLVIASGKPKILVASPPPTTEINGACDTSCIVDFFSDPSDDCSYSGCLSGTIGSYASNGYGDGAWSCAGLNGGATVNCVLSSPVP